MLASILIMFPILRAVGKNLVEQRMMPWAFLALAVSMGLMAMNLRLAVLAVLITVYFVGFNLLEAAMPSLLARITGSKGRGRRMGVYSTFQFLGAFAGGVTGGWLLGAFGGHSALLVAAGVCLVWGILLKALFSDK
jgi:MFS family permease